MKKFTVPKVVIENKEVDYCYDSEYSKVFQYEKDKFLLEIDLSFQMKCRDHGDFTKYQYFVVSDEIIPILTNCSQVRAGLTKEFFWGACLDTNGEIYIKYVATKFKLPFFKESNHDDINRARTPERGFFKYKNKGIITGNLANEKLSLFYLGDVEIKQNDFLIINFHSDNCFEFKIMSFADEGNLVCAVSISRDGLTGCALVECKNGNFEAIVIDLE